jgi:hypothetical protein
MNDNRDDATAPWYKASAKNLVLFALMWLGEGFLTLLFVKWVIHGSVAVYWLLVPWALFGLVILLRPNWILSVTRGFDKFLEQVGESLEKRPPPGFP